MSRVVSKIFYFRTMSLVLKTCAPIDNLIATSDYELEWIPCSQVTDVEPTQIDNVYYAIRKKTFDEEDDEVYETIMLLSLGSREECTQTLVNEFARVYSLPAHKYKNNVSHYRRYEKWLYSRNDLIKGFTTHDDKYYMVADRCLYHCYTRYGSALNAVYSDVVPCGVSVDINNYLMDGLATIRNSMT